MAIVITSPADNTAIGTSAQRRSFTVTATGLTGTRDGGFQRVCMFMHNDAAPNITEEVQMIGRVNRVIINGETDQQYHAFGVNLAAVNETFYLIVVDEALDDFRTSLPRNLANEAKGTKFQSVRLRRVAPPPQTQTIVVTAPSSNPSATASSSYTVTWTATAQDAAIIRVFDAAVGGNQVGTDVNVSGSTKSQAITLPATAGTYYIQVVVTAAGYRAATSALAAITVTATTPTLRNQTVTITSPAASATVGQSIDVTWGATHQDSAVICVFDTAAGTSPIGTESITDGTMSGTVTVGNHTGDAWIEVIVTSTRFLESKNSPRLKVTVDANPPPPVQTLDVTITAPGEDTRVDTPFAIAWTVSDQTTVQVILQERDGSEITRLSHTQGGAVSRRQTTMATTHTGEAWILIQSTHNSVTSSSSRRRVYVGVDPPGTPGPDPVVPVTPGDPDAPAGSIRNTTGIAANVTLTGKGAFAIGVSSIGGLSGIGVGADTPVISLVESFTVRRGRTTTDQVIAPGSATVVLRNDEGQFEALNSSASFGGIQDGMILKITIENAYVFTGRVYDWRYNYLQAGVASVIEVSAYDDATAFSNASFDNQVARPTESATARVRALAGASGWNGVIEFPATTEQTVEDIYNPSSLGSIMEPICLMANYVITGSRSGGVKFVQESARTLPFELTVRQGGNVSALQRERQRTDFWSGARATRPGDMVTPVVVSTPSELEREADLGELPAVTELQLRRALDRWLTINGAGGLRFSGLEVMLENLSISDRQELARTDIGDAVQLRVKLPHVANELVENVSVKSVRYTYSTGQTIRCVLDMANASEPFVAPENVNATGGTITTSGGYRYHTFVGGSLPHYLKMDSLNTDHYIESRDDLPSGWITWSGMSNGNDYDEFDFNVIANPEDESFDVLLVGGGGDGYQGHISRQEHPGAPSGLRINVPQSVSGWLLSDGVFTHGLDIGGSITSTNPTRAIVYSEPSDNGYVWHNGVKYARAGGVAVARRPTRHGSERWGSQQGAEGEDGFGNGAWMDDQSRSTTSATNGRGGSTWYRAIDNVSAASMGTGVKKVRVGRGASFLSPGSSTADNRRDGGTGVVIIRYRYVI